MTNQMTFEETVAAAQVAIDEHGVVGFIYTRISEDPEGLTYGVQAQSEDCREKLAEPSSVPVVRVFEDNDISASTLSQKVRPDYVEMLRVVEALPKNTVKIFAYSNSRLTRRPLELEGLIDLHKKTGVVIRTVVSGDDDLSTADGRMVARIKSNIDAAEAEKTSERVARRVAQFRSMGISGPGGARAFGYERGGTRIIEAEAEAIRQGAEILLKGGTTGDVIRTWTQAGIKPVRADRWHRRTIQGIYRSPRLAGLLEWDGMLRESVNAPAILDRATWEAVVEALRPKTDLGRDPGWWNTKNLLSGLLKCSGCGHGMKAKGKHYGCLSERGGCGKTFRNRAWVDGLVSDAMDVRLLTLPTANPGAEIAEATKAHAEIERLEQLIVDTREALARGELAKEDAFPLIASSRDQLNALRKEEVINVQVAASKMHPDTALALWQSDDLAKKRRALAAEIEMVMIHPLDRRNGYGRHRPLPPESVDILWRS